MTKKIVKRIVIGLLILIIVPLAIVYTWSTIIIHKTYDVPLTAIHIPNDTLPEINFQAELFDMGDLTIQKEAAHN